MRNSCVNQKTNDLKVETQTKEDIDTKLTAFSMLEKCCILLDRIFCICIREAIAVP